MYSLQQIANDTFCISLYGVLDILYIDFDYEMFLEDMGYGQLLYEINEFNRASQRELRRAHKYNHENKISRKIL